VILLAAGTKSRQQRDIATAQKRWTDYKKRKKVEKVMQIPDGSSYSERGENPWH
jgi:hypothetical protein